MTSLCVLVLLAIASLCSGMFRACHALEREVYSLESGGDLAADQVPKVLAYPNAGPVIFPVPCRPLGIGYFDLI